MAIIDDDEGANVEDVVVYTSSAFGVIIVLTIASCSGVSCVET